MTPEQFAYWLNGFVELGNGSEPTPEQWKSIREHLGTVFKKVTPEVGVAAKKAAEMDWNEIYKQMQKQQPHPQQTPPGYPWPSTTQPWFQTGTIIC